MRRPILPIVSIALFLSSIWLSITEHDFRFTVISGAFLIVSLVQISRERSSNAHPSESSQRTILIVEDERSVLQGLADYLSREVDANILTATTGRDAITKLRVSKVDLLITDLGLPDMPGTEIIQAVRTGAHIHSATNPRIPVVIISGVPIDRMDILAATNACQYIQKPVELPEVLAAVRTSLRHGQN